MQKRGFNDGLLEYLQASPTPFHAVTSMVDTLQTNGFTALSEKDAWDLVPGRYYVVRNGSSIIAFVRGKKDPVETGIRMVGAHTDSPCLKLKPRPVNITEGYLHLGVEVYGGVLLNPWYDRDLSLAGRITCLGTDGKIRSYLINFERAIATVPSLAIHLDREANSARSVNPQTDIPPVLMRTDKEEETINPILTAQIKKQHANAKIKRILGYELAFYDTQPPAITGLKADFIASARLDNLLSCYTGMISLLEASPNVTSLLVCNDHEEVGSASAEGAQGPFLQSVIERLVPDTSVRHQSIARSLLISTDNAHGIHPNYADRHDGNHGPIMNKGPVIKVNSNQRYATNSESAGYFANLCHELKVPYQVFVNRTDMACGSTIGPLTAKEIGVRTLDVGVPTFAMHSIR
ncbi:MAG: M18 family aminopeptidase, partial [Pseudohongiellaceae bacterium]